MRTPILIAFFLVAAGVGCAEPVPQTPTWVDDVQPMLRGNCFHCHGGVEQPPEAFRWDVFNRDEFADFEPLPYTMQQFRGASVGTILLLGYVKSTDPRMRMPPPPALPLSDRDLEILTKWAARPERGTRRGNSRPNARLVTGSQVQQEGMDVLVTLDVSDGDGDTVIGKVTMGMGSGLVLRTGRQTVRVVGARANDPIRVTLSDGQDVVTDIDPAR